MAVALGLLLSRASTELARVLRPTISRVPFLKTPTPSVDAVDVDVDF